jgi:hypothetical protein
VYVDDVLRIKQGALFTSLYDRYVDLIKAQLIDAGVRKISLNTLDNQKLLEYARDFNPTKTLEEIMCFPEDYFSHLKIGTVERELDQLIGGQTLTVLQFKVDSAYMRTTDEDGVPLCYARYYWKVPSDQALAVSEAKVTTGEDYWELFKTHEKDATLGEFDKWINNFVDYFNPLNLTPPAELAFSRIVPVFINGGLVRGFYFLLKIFFFYLTKILFWIIMYSILMYIWTKAAPNMSIYWLLIVLLIVLILLNKWNNYEEFVDMFRLGP